MTARRNVRRTAAIARLQQTRPGLKVWFTLPVAPQGLTEDSIALLDGLLAGGVKLAGVNGMTMDYGGSREGLTMHEATVAALTR